MKLVIPLHSLYWSIHTKDESKRGTAFAFIFGVNWLLRCGVTASFRVFFHGIKRNGMTSFTEFTSDLPPRGRPWWNEKEKWQPRIKRLTNRATSAGQILMHIVNLYDMSAQLRMARFPGGSWERANERLMTAADSCLCTTHLPRPNCSPFFVAFFHGFSSVSYWILTSSQVFWPPCQEPASSRALQTDSSCVWAAMM